MGSSCRIADGDIGCTIAGACSIRIKPGRIPHFQTSIAHILHMTTTINHAAIRIYRIKMSIRSALLSDLMHN